MLTSCQPAPSFSTAPAPLAQPEASTIPDAPRDTSEPFEAVLWTLKYDLRTFDDLWSWLQNDVPDSAARHRAIGVAGLTGIAELSRFELADATLTSLDQAIAAYPNDPRLPLWASYIRWVKAYKSGDAPAVAAGYEDLEAKGQLYPSFTLFGLTLAIAADENATAERVQQGRDAYDRVVSEAGDLQFEAGVVAADRMHRTADFDSAPYNLSGTQALIGDMHLRAGDWEQAQVAYYTALHTNAAYRWPFRDEVQRRMENAEALAGSMEDELGFGALWNGARNVGERGIQEEGYGGRIGNGSCTLCHTALRRSDRAGGHDAAVGFVRLRYVAPEETPNPFPVFVALPEANPDSIPAGFAIGQTSVTPSWGEQVDARTYDLLMPAEPGRWFIAGQLFGGELGARANDKWETYLAKGLFDRPRFIDVRAGEITDIRNVPLVFERED